MAESTDFEWGNSTLLKHVLSIMDERAEAEVRMGALEKEVNRNTGRTQGVSIAWGVLGSLIGAGASSAIIIGLFHR